jgi:DNA-directed RNA polymerase subunit alpha
MRVGERTDFDKLLLEIETDGTITPKEAFYKSCDILIKHFTFISERNENQKELSSEKKEKKLKAKKPKKESKKEKKNKK